MYFYQMINKDQRPIITQLSAAAATKRDDTKQ